MEFSLAFNPDTSQLSFEKYSVLFNSNDAAIAVLFFIRIVGFVCTAQETKKDNQITVINQQQSKAERVMILLFLLPLHYHRFFMLIKKGSKILHKRKKGLKKYGVQRKNVKKKTVRNTKFERRGS